MRTISTKKQRGECNNRKTGTVSVSVILLAAIPSAHAAPWDFGANIDLGIIHTDNLLLDDDGMETSAYVYTIAPELHLTTDGDRIDANLRYRPEALYYSDRSDANSVFHVVDASFTGALVRDRFFIDLNASNFQSIITPEGQIPTSNIPVTGNRIDSQTLEVKPYWTQRFSQADMRVEAAYRDMSYDTEASRSYSQHRGSFNLDNFAQQEGVAWGLNYRYIRTEYDRSRPWEFQQSSLNLGYWFTDSLRIFGVAGAESSHDNFNDSDLGSGYWEGGFQYRPNQRLNMEFAAGDRSYGNSYRGSFTYQMRRGEIALNYNEGPSSISEQGYGYRPLVDTDNLDNVFNQASRSDRYIQKRGEIRASIGLSKSNLTLRLFSEEREFRSTAAGMPLSDEKLEGGAVRWSWELSRKTTLGVDYDISERERAADVFELRRARIDVNFNLSQRLDLNLAFMRSENDTKSRNNFDYVENQIRLMLRTRLW